MVDLHRGCMQTSRPVFDCPTPGHSNRRAGRLVCFWHFSGPWTVCWLTDNSAGVYNWVYLRVASKGKGRLFLFPGLTAPAPAGREGLVATTTTVLLKDASLPKGVLMDLPASPSLFFTYKMLLPIPSDSKPFHYPNRISFPLKRYHQSSSAK